MTSMPGVAIKAHIADLVEKHGELLERAVTATRTRGFWAAYPEMPSGKIYGENAKEQAETTFRELLGTSFSLDLPGTRGAVGGERSPYGFDLGIRYPQVDLDQVIAAARVALPSWRRVTPKERAAVCLEILERLNKASFDIATAVMHTTGQAFMMAFQAGGPHAQDRGLEAVAYAWRAQTDVPGDEIIWEKPQGKKPPLTLRKHWHVSPRGLSVVIGCSTFPTWNAYPGIFASLATGNPVIVKPHPHAVLPLALTVKIGREVLAEAGFDPNLLILVADNFGTEVTRELCSRPEIRIIDFTGSPVFGAWLEEHCRHAKVYTEKAGLNFAVIDSTDDFRGMISNLAFTLSLYTGQMCTTTQNIFIPANGIQTDQGHKSFRDVAQALADAIEALLSDSDKALEILGAVASEAVDARMRDASQYGDIVLESRTLEHPRFAGAKVRTPALVCLDRADEARYGSECFGAVTFLIATENTHDSMEVARRTAIERGAVSAAVYSTCPAVVESMTEACLDAQVSLSVNLHGGIFVNQTSAFSDFHGTGGNPSGSVALTDLAFVADRFRFVGIRWPA